MGVASPASLRRRIRHLKHARQHVPESRFLQGLLRGTLDEAQQQLYQSHPMETQARILERREAELRNLVTKRQTRMQLAQQLLQQAETSLARTQEVLAQLREKIRVSATLPVLHTEEGGRRQGRYDGIAFFCCAGYVTAA